MKTCLALAFTFIGSLTVFAQVKPDNKDFFFYDLSYLSLMNNGGGLEQQGFSNGHSLTLMGEKLFGTSRVGIGYGIGYSSENYYTNMAISTNPVNGDEVYTVLNVDSAGAKNKFNQKFVDGAIELRFRTKQANNGRFFRFYVGAKGGIRFAGYSEFVNNDLNVQYRDIDEFSRFHGSVYARIGYGFISLYGSYGLTPIFKSGVTDTGFMLEDLRPLANGLSISI